MVSGDDSAKKGTYTVVSYSRKLHLKTRYCPLSIAHCNLLAAIFEMLKILRLLFVARIELFNNNGRLASVKPKQQQRRAKLNSLYWAFNKGLEKQLTS